jgi:hypothetical protein
LLLKPAGVEDLVTTTFLLEFETDLLDGDSDCDELLEDPSSAGRPAPPPQAVKNINKDAQTKVLIFPSLLLCVH